VAPFAPEPDGGVPGGDAAAPPRVDGGPGTPVEAAAFCDALTDAICSAVAACDCAAGSEDTCRSRLTMQCDAAFTAELLASIAGGRAVYSADAAGRMIAQIRAGGCELPDHSLGWTYRDLIDLGGVIEGTIAPGAPCTAGRFWTADWFMFVDECARGSCNGSVCTVVAGSGEACTTLSTTCIDLDAPLRDPRFGVPTEECRVDASGTSGVCIGRLANGEMCTWGGQCETDRCECDRAGCVEPGVCAPKLENGDICAGSQECASNYCGLDSFCATGDSPVGASCPVSRACASDVCQEGVCVQPICVLGQT